MNLIHNDTFIICLMLEIDCLASKKQIQKYIAEFKEEFFGLSAEDVAFPT